MSYSSRYFPRPGISSDQPSRRRKLLTILAVGATALALGGCGGEGSGDVSTPAAAADAAAPGAVADAAVPSVADAGVADTGQVADDTSSGATNIDDSPTHNRVVLRRSGQGD
jgi:hypothetical protein